MDKEDLRKHWTDANNWRAGIVYNCPADPRIIVPLRSKGTGYAINFAHSGAPLVLTGIILALLAPFSALLVFEFVVGILVSLVSFSIVVGFLTFLCHREATREG